MRFIRKWLAILLLLLLAALWLFPERFGLTGNQVRTASDDKISVRDGDTLRIGEQDYRLYGIDAPEFTQICKDEAGQDWACGKMARLELASLVKGRTIECEERAHDKYQRFVATCKDETGRDIARAMAERGMAVSFGGFSEGPYADEEAAAKRAKRGLWRGSFDPPSSWRAQKGTRKAEGRPLG